MEWIYLFFLLVGGELRIKIAGYDSNGMINVRFGAAFFCRIYDIIILTLSIRYCGWILGIIISAAYLFSILHNCYTWVLSIPAILFANSEDHVDLIISCELIILSYILVPLGAIFTVVSLFFNTWELFANYFSFESIIIILIIGVILYLVSLAVGLKLKEKGYASEETAERWYTCPKCGQLVRQGTECDCKHNNFKP